MDLRFGSPCSSIICAGYLPYNGSGLKAPYLPARFHSSTTSPVQREWIEEAGTEAMMEAAPISPAQREWIEETATGRRSRSSGISPTHREWIKGKLFWGKIRIHKDISRAAGVDLRCFCKMDYAER